MSPDSATTRKTLIWEKKQIIGVVAEVPSSFTLQPMLKMELAHIALQLEGEVQR